MSIDDDIDVETERLSTLESYGLYRYRIRRKIHRYPTSNS